MNLGYKIIISLKFCFQWFVNNWFFDNLANNGAPGTNLVQQNIVFFRK